MPRKLHLSVLVIDDDVSWCKDICRQLTLSSRDELKTSGAQRVIHNPLELNFVPFTPRRDESAQDFCDRFSSLLENNVEVPKNLCCIVFDLDLKFRRNTQQLQAPILAGIAQAILPTVQRFLLTNYDPDEVVASHFGLFDKPVRKTILASPKGPAIFVNSIAEKLKHGLETPYWNALHDFANEDKIVLHALANTEQRTMLNSVSFDEFADFVGGGYFKTEASSTTAPLGSLLHTGHSLLEAENVFASTFGASRARFVTNGTTTSNKIAHLSICRENDQVILDRYCHISHHYAVALGRTRPVYLDARYSREHGIPSQIVASQVTGILERLFESAGANAPLPALIALTNCTFDGMILPPMRLFQEVRRTLENHKASHRMKELTFLFDEAWFGFARFHPGYAQYSSLTAKQILSNKDPWWADNLRLYVTQSVHKTLSAFRQASVLLISDPVLDGAMGKSAAWEQAQRLDSAFSAHTTTSPLSGMLASLDVGRRQIQFEGRGLIDGMMQRANEFRKFVDDLGAEMPAPDGAPSIRALKASDLISGGDAAEGNILDATKVTLANSGWMSGREMRIALWHKQKIQVNKFSDHSVLCLFTIGMEKQQLTDLKNRIRSLMRQAKQKSLFAQPKRVELPFPANPIKYYYQRQPTLPLLDGVAPKGILGFDPGKFLIGPRHESREFLKLTPHDVQKLPVRLSAIVAASFVVPYPPGYPVLIPGQVVERSILQWLANQATREIHGLVEDDGARYLPVYRMKEISERGK